MASQIQYGIIPSSKADETQKFLVKNFFPHEPISRAFVSNVKLNVIQAYGACHQMQCKVRLQTTFSLPINQVTRWFPPQVGDCLKLGISIGARDVNTNELVGVAINIIVEKTLKKSNDEGEKTEGRGLLEVLDPEKEAVMVNIAKFLGILNQSSDDIYKSRLVSAKDTIKTFNCIYLAVLPSYGGKGIGNKLIEESEKIAKQTPGIDFLQVDTTSDFSYRIFHLNCGYEVVKEMDLAPHIPGIDKIDNGVHKKGRLLLKKL